MIAAPFLFRNLLLVFISASCFAAVCTESAVDLRPLLSEVKNQGDRNTCNVFAATALMEYVIWKEAGETIDLSEAYAYWAAKKHALDNDFLKDAYLGDDALAGYLAVTAYRYGSMKEEEWPYGNQNWQQTHNPGCVITESGKPCMECFTGTPPAEAQVLIYRAEPVFIERDKIGEFILSEKKPVVFNIWWYSKAVDEKTGDFHMPSGYELSDRGGHVILLVGYDRESRRFLFRNSWGPGWGNNGYGTLPEEYILKHYEANQLQDLLSQPGISPEVKDYIIKCGQGASAKLKKNLSDGKAAQGS
ncbi:MAG: C1 family peptidase [Candidatus Wallbacteria bacterium]|nr:C1 family peptidase [Candidatus Wallbacteria bacterium]